MEVGRDRAESALTASECGESRGKAGGGGGGSEEAGGAAAAHDGGE